MLYRGNQEKISIHAAEREIRFLLFETPPSEKFLNALDAAPSVKFR